MDHSCTLSICFGSGSPPCPRGALTPATCRCPFPRGRGTRTASPARRACWGSERLRRRQSHVLSAGMIKQHMPACSRGSPGDALESASFCRPVAPLPLCCGALRSVPTRRTRIYGHTWGGTQSSDLENCGSVTDVLTKCAADSANLSIALQKRHTHTPASPQKGKG